MASAGEATDKIFWYLIDPPSTPDFSGKVGLNFAKGLVTSTCRHVGDLHAVGWLLPVAVMLGTCMLLAGENL